MPIVQNNQPRQITLTGKYGRRGTKVSSPTSVTLMPGVNDVDPKAWAAVKDRKLTKARVANGKLVVRDDSASFDIAKKPQHDAIALVKATYNGDLLDRWRRDDSRKAVRDAIDDQFAKLSPSKAA